MKKMKKKKKKWKISFTFNTSRKGVKQDLGSILENKFGLNCIKIDVNNERFILIYINFNSILGAKVVLFDWDEIKCRNF